MRLKTAITSQVMKTTENAISETIPSNKQKNRPNSCSHNGFVFINCFPNTDFSHDDVVVRCMMKMWQESGRMGWDGVSVNELSGISSVTDKSFAFY